MMYYLYVKFESRITIWLIYYLYVKFQVNFLKNKRVFKTLNLERFCSKKNNSQNRQMKLDNKITFRKPFTNTYMMEMIEAKIS